MEYGIIKIVIQEIDQSGVVGITMKTFLNNIRYKEKSISFSKQIRNTIAILFLGIVLGIFSKFLDNTASNDLPFIVELLDITNFLGRFAIWVLIGLCISIYSNSSIRASINVFVFFAGMVTSYLFMVVVILKFVQSWSYLFSSADLWW